MGCVYCGTEIDCKMQYSRVVPFDTPVILLTCTLCVDKATAWFFKKPRQEDGQIYPILITPIY